MSNRILGVSAVKEPGDTFTFREDSMLSSAEAIIKFGPMRKEPGDLEVRKSSSQVRAFLYSSPSKRRPPMPLTVSKSK